MLLARLYSVNFAPINSFTHKSARGAIAVTYVSFLYGREIEVTCQEEQTISSLQVTRKSLDGTWSFMERLEFWFRALIHQNFLGGFKKWKCLALSPQTKDFLPSGST